MNKYLTKQSAVNQIEMVLDQIRPALQNHGGNVEVVGFDNGVVKVKLTGHCHDCLISTVTLKLGIERALCANLPNLVKKVIEVK
ncbi:MAG: NifU family protein [Patescibacteria group bacterium]|jgi:Fe-S cluster biogenesis protein NfuA